MILMYCIYHHPKSFFTGSRLSFQRQITQYCTLFQLFLTSLNFCHVINNIQGVSNITQVSVRMYLCFSKFPDVCVCFSLGYDTVRVSTVVAEGGGLSLLVVFMVTQKLFMETHTNIHLFYLAFRNNAQCPLLLVTFEMNKSTCN